MSMRYGRDYAGNDKVIRLAQDLLCSAQFKDSILNRIQPRGVRFKKSFQPKKWPFQHIPGNDRHKIRDSSSDWQRQKLVLIQMKASSGIKRNLFQQIDSVADCPGINQKPRGQN